MRRTLALVLYFTILSCNEIKEKKEDENTLIKNNVNVQTECVGIYKNKIRDGIWKCYYDNAVLKKESFFAKNDQPFGSEFQYNDNGSLKRYLLHSLDGVMYKQEHDSLGEMISSEGKSSFIYFNRDTFEINEKFNFILFVGGGKNRVDCEITLHDNAGESEMDTFEIKYDSLLYRNSFFYEKKLENQGGYKCEVKYTATPNGILIKDSLVVNLFVR